MFQTEKTDSSKVNFLFEKAVLESDFLKKIAEKNVMHKLYGLYMQSTVGDIDIPKPEGKADKTTLGKYAAWEALKGKPRKKAQQEFILLINKLKD